MLKKASEFTVAVITAVALGFLLVVVAASSDAALALAVRVFVLSLLILHCYREWGHLLIPTFHALTGGKYVKEAGATSERQPPTVDNAGNETGSDGGGSRAAASESHA